MNDSATLENNRSIPESEMWEWFHRFFDGISTEIAALSDGDRALLARMAIDAAYNRPLPDQNEPPECLQNLLQQLEWLPRWELPVLRELGLSVFNCRASVDSQNR